MTRSVTLADLMPSRVDPTAKAAAASSSTEGALGPGSTPCFAEALETAGSAGMNTDKENRHGEGGQDAGRDTDPVGTIASSATAGEPTPVPAAVALASLAGSQPLADVETCPPLPATRARGPARQLARPWRGLAPHGPRARAKSFELAGPGAAA